MRKKLGPDRLISHERLLTLVTYDPLTGKFYARVRRQGYRRAGDLGCVEPNGYRRIQVDGERYLAGRLAWFYVHGQWPESEIDHRDLDRDNNRIGNLRPATTSQNHANTGQPRGSQAPLKGAHWNRFRDHWQSYIKIDGRSVYLGRFQTADAAHRAYAAAASRLRGEFGRSA